MNTTSKYFICALSALGSLNLYAESDDSSNNKIAYKLTSAYYAADSTDAYDFNLRANTGDHTAWIGQYQDQLGFRQSRAGYEYKQDLEIARITWSAQVASRGFVGGSVTAELGGDTYAILGFGRTNLHDYYNLNFDPNDALTAGIGSRAFDNTEISLFKVWDDRLATGQQISHGVVRYKPSKTTRITVDTSYKSGQGADGNYYEGYGISLTYDYGRYFIRLAKDQHANFTRDDVVRGSLGLRF